jgi:hypothetical protein
MAFHVIGPHLEWQPFFPTISLVVVLHSLQILQCQQDKRILVLLVAILHPFELFRQVVLHGARGYVRLAGGAGGVSGDFKRGWRIVRLAGEF